MLEGAVLVAVEVLGGPAVRQTGEQEQVVARELQRTEDRRQLPERPGFLRPPRLEDRTAGDGEDPHPQAAA